MYIYFLENQNGGARVLTEHHRYRGVGIDPCGPGMATCSRDVVRGMHGTGSYS